VKTLKYQVRQSGEVVKIPGGIVIMTVGQLFFFHLVCHFCYFAILLWQLACFQ